MAAAIIETQGSKVDWMPPAAVFNNMAQIHSIRFAIEEMFGVST
jgi:hypothetical protein